MNNLIREKLALFSQKRQNRWNQRPTAEITREEHDDAWVVFLSFTSWSQRNKMVMTIFIYDNKHVSHNLFTIQDVAIKTSVWCYYAPNSHLYEKLITVFPKMSATYNSRTMMIVTRYDA